VREEEFGVGVDWEVVTRKNGSGVVRLYCRGWRLLVVDAVVVVVTARMRERRDVGRCIFGLLLCLCKIGISSGEIEYFSSVLT
jgi:hypothetical protein